MCRGGCVVGTVLLTRDKIIYIVIVPASRALGVEMGLGVGNVHSPPPLNPYLIMFARRKVSGIKSARVAFANPILVSAAP